MAQIIGFAGAGVMGSSMAGHLIKAGYAVHIHSRTRAKAEPLLKAGAVWEDTIAGLARSANVVITMLGFPSDVEDAYFGDNGLIAQAKSGAVLIDMTTSKPSLAKRIYEAARERGVGSLDAPVSGGDIGAREARLSIMAGGDPETFQAVLPVLGLMGKQIVLQGGPGAGQHAKMCNQIAVAAGMMGVCEALVYAKRMGLDQGKVLESIGSGAAGSWALSNMAPRILRKDYRPGFFVKHFIKDMAIALEAAEEMKLDLPALALAKSLYDRLAADGHGVEGTQALYKHYDPEG